MCKQEPGPRCSYDAQIKYTKASENYLRRQEQAEKQKRQNKPVGYRLSQQYKTAYFRFINAQKSYDMTEAGQKELKKEISSLKTKMRYLNSIPYSDRNEKQKITRAQQINQLTQLQKRKEQGLEKRKSSQQDLKDFGKLRKNFTKIKTTINKNKNPENKTTQIIDIVSILEKTQNQHIKKVLQYPEIDLTYDRIKYWVSATTPFKKTETHKLPDLVGNEKIGKKLLAEPVVCYIQINSPDGHLIEAKKTLINIFNEHSNKYQIIEEFTIAAKWENISPADFSTKPLGSLLHSKNNNPIVIKETILKEHENKIEAQQYYAEKVSKNFSTEDTTLVVNNLISYLKELVK